MGNYHDLKPSDYDYPMSYAFRSYVEEQCTGKPLPPIDPPEREATPLFEAPEPAWSRDQWQYIKQMRAQVLHLNTKVTELSAKRKPKGQY